MRLAIGLFINSTGLSVQAAYCSQGKRPVVIAINRQSLNAFKEIIKRKVEKKIEDISWAIKLSILPVGAAI